MASRYRFLIERSGNDVFPFHLCTVDPQGENTGSLGDYATVEEAQESAAGMAQSGEDTEEWGKRVALVWKDPPEAWRPDAITVSQYLTEMYPGLGV